MPPLVEPTALSDFPGAPFAASIVESAAESVRTEAGWHIAPSVTETVTVVSNGGTVLAVKSLKVTDVATIRDVSGETPETLNGWVARESGIIERPGGWPIRHAIEVDLVHGYAACPPELLSVIAERCQRASVDSTVSQMARGPFSVSIRAEGASSRGADVKTASDAILARYTVPASP